MYDANGKAIARKFNKKTISKNEWRYETFLTADTGCYIIEHVPAGYTAQYVNVGKYAGVTDRCHAGGTIINSKTPATGDSGHPILLIALSAASVGVGLALMRGRKRQKNDF